MTNIQVDGSHSELPWDFQEAPSLFAVTSTRLFSAAHSFSMHKDTSLS